MNAQIKKMTRMAILIAVSIVMVYLIHFPIFPQVTFLEYDPADIPILIAGFAYGPLAGIVVTIIASLIQGMTVSAASGIYGIIMHILATSALVAVSSFFYKRHKTKRNAIISLVLGSIAMIVVMSLANLVVTPYFMGVDVSFVVGLMPFIVLFNAIKAIVNSMVTFILYKRLSSILR